MARRVGSATADRDESSRFMVISTMIYIDNCQYIIWRSAELPGTLVDLSGSLSHCRFTHDRWAENKPPAFKDSNINQGSVFRFEPISRQSVIDRKSTRLNSSH